MLKLAALIFVLSIDPSFALSKKSNVQDCKEKAKGECLVFKGRARVYGKGTTRIWKVGSNRMYQVVSHSEAAFNDMNHLTFSTQMFADYDVCLIKPETPSGIQDICVQNVKDAKTTAMPE